MPVIVSVRDLHLRPKKDHIGPIIIAKQAHHQLVQWEEADEVGASYQSLSFG